MSGKSCGNFTEQYWVFEGHPELVITVGVECMITAKQSFLNTRCRLNLHSLDEELCGLVLLQVGIRYWDILHTKRIPPQCNFNALVHQVIVTKEAYLGPHVAG